MTISIKYDQGIICPNLNGLIAWYIAAIVPKHENHPIMHFTRLLRIRLIFPLKKLVKILPDTEDFDGLYVDKNSLFSYL
jgi:hypothetical protein